MTPNELKEKVLKNKKKDLVSKREENQNKEAAM